ncbi:MAG: hypothetical protein JWO33_315 [Caulobacteraceae bacterium]|nr:hypothetical protein [Caulobacteraceae bacterium]
MGGQGDAEHGDRPFRRMRSRVALVALAWTLAAAAQSAERTTPSGLPVPRYVSLKFDTVNARSGPGDDHRMMWVYRARGLPLQVVAETSEWRRVCDPQGGLVWVHRRTVDLRRTVINLQGKPMPLRKKPKIASPAVALLAPRALATLVRCEDGWCRLKVDGVSGWTREGELWGTDERPQCR